MSWVTIVWSMEIAAALTLAAVHLVIWARQRRAWANLLFAGVAVSVAGMAVFEFLMMRAQTPAEFATMNRWMHVPAFTTCLTIVGFIRVYLQAGRLWFLWSVVGLRAIVLVANFVSPANVNYWEVTSLVHATFLGETISVARGVANPWSRFDELTALWLIAFVVDASITLWRRGGAEERRRAVVVGGSMALFVLVALTHITLVRFEVIRSPQLAGFSFMFFVVAMAFELSRDLLRAAQLAEELRESEQRTQRHRLELAHVSRVSIMGELSASMAHELNQPLTAILTNAQAGQRFLAAGKPDLEEFREILKDIAHDTARARDVIRHLRALVKKSEPVFTEVDLVDAIHEVVGFLHGDIVARNVRVALELSPNLPPIHGDRIQLQQVMINLLLNAFDAMNGDPVPERLVTASTEVESPRFVCVTVRDQGTGIPADKLEAIFEPFYTTKREGMGMGLSVTRSIVESHGGRIWAENIQPRGAAFHFTLRAVGGGGSNQESLITDH